MRCPDLIQRDEFYAYHSESFDQCRSGGNLRRHVYAVPVKFQATNFLFASGAALDKVGATMPETRDELFATSDKLRAAGIIPYAQAGDCDIWFMNTFAAVLASVGGTEGWQQFTGQAGADYVRSDAFKPVAQILAKLPKYADSGVEILIAE
jgi:glucose/mannose transport system substrate-binding protein